MMTYFECVFTNFVYFLRSSENLLYACIYLIIIYWSTASISRIIGLWRGKCNVKQLLERRPWDRNLAHRKNALDMNLFLFNCYLFSSCQILTFIARHCNSKINHQRSIYFNQGKHIQHALGMTMNHQWGDLLCELVRYVCRLTLCIYNVRFVSHFSDMLCPNVDPVVNRIQHYTSASDSYVIITFTYRT